MHVLYLFLGTLNPSLQDTQGRPWPGIATIIHILNDLLCANPRHGSFCNHGATSAANTSSNSNKRKTAESSESSEQVAASKKHKKELEVEEEAEERERRLSGNHFEDIYVYFNRKSCTLFLNQTKTA